MAKAIESDAVPEYHDADTFFRRTFLTRGLRSTLKGVLRRLAGRDDGVAITQMATVFGGGKTHILLALYHIVEHGDQVTYLEPLADTAHPRRHCPGPDHRPNAAHPGPGPAVGGGSTLDYNGTAVVDNETCIIVCKKCGHRRPVR